LRDFLGEQLVEEFLKRHVPDLEQPRQLLAADRVALQDCAKDEMAETGATGMVETMNAVRRHARPLLFICAFREIQGAMMPRGIIVQFVASRNRGAG
jgi:hypothetical protein